MVYKHCRWIRAILNAFEVWIYLWFINTFLLFHSSLFNIITIYIVNKSTNTIFIYQCIDNLPSNGILLIIISGPFVSCSLMNFNFFLSQTVQFVETIVLLFFAFTTLGLLLSVFFLHFNQHNSIILYIA